MIMLLRKISRHSNKMCVDTDEYFESHPLEKEYRGLRPEDLCIANPYYSCVLCAHPECPDVGTTRGSCTYHVDCSEEEFAARYDFKTT